MDWSQLGAIDWVIIVVVSLSTLLSLVRGFVREALSLAGWVAAFVVANIFVDEMASILSGLIANITGRYVAAYAVLFVLTLILAGIATKLAVGLVNMTGLSLLDRLLGTVFGFARGVIVILVIVFVLRQLLPPRELDWLQDSRLLPQLDMLAQWTQTVFAQFNGVQWRGIST